MNSIESPILIESAITIQLVILIESCDRDQVCDQCLNVIVIEFAITIQLEIVIALVGNNDTCACELLCGPWQAVYMVVPLLKYFIRIIVIHPD